MPIASGLRMRLWRVSVGVLFTAVTSMGGCESDSNGPPAGGAATAGQGGAALAGEGGVGSDAAGAGVGGQQTAGQGGEGTPACPLVLADEEGKDCRAFGEGFECTDGGTDPCEFGNAIVCTGGAWERRESFPAPCGGASGRAAD